MRSSGQVECAECVDCTAVQVDTYRNRDGTNNCFLFGNQPQYMVTTTNNIMVIFGLGTCQQIDQSIAYSEYHW